QSRYSSVKGPAFQPASSKASLMPLTTVSVWALALPVRGRLETILIVVSEASSPGAQPANSTSTGAARMIRAVPSRRRGVMTMLLGFVATSGQCRQATGPPRGGSQVVLLCAGG